MNANDGMAALLTAIKALPDEQRTAVQEAIDDAYADGPALAMVDSDRGITNLHVPSDVIIDASMPAAIRASGQMWNAAGDQQDTKFVIPDHSYAELYAEAVNHCRQHGAFDPATMGTTPNVGLMAQQAEEYGSHDKTFEIAGAGRVRVVDDAGETLLEHDVQEGDIWRMCQTKDAPVQDWVRLAVSRARATGGPAVFWLDETRPHDQELLRKVRPALDGARYRRAPDRDPRRRRGHALHARARPRREDTISVTGNVLRDYLTDLFPILELGTSAKMLSIVPLMSGGGLFETGAGGSAPKHVQQFTQENHLRWDSLGEFLALAASLEMVADKDGNARAKYSRRRSIGRPAGCWRRTARRRARRASSTTAAVTSTSRSAGPRSSPLRRTTRSWPSASGRWPSVWGPTRRRSSRAGGGPGSPVDIGGYYRPDPERGLTAMRPSATFNEALDAAAGSGWRGITGAVGREAPLQPGAERTGPRPGPKGEGWFVLNAREARWLEGDFGAYTRFEGDARFAQVGINIGVLAPGQPACYYHARTSRRTSWSCPGSACC